MKTYLIILALLLGGNILLAQYSDIDQFALGNLGGEISNSDYSITQSVGDLIGTQEGTTGQGYLLTQGFPQCLSCTDCVDLSVSVTPPFVNSLVKVFPNPTSGNLTLEGEVRFLHHYELYTSTGQLILREYLNANVRQLNLSDLGTGLYFLRIYDRQQQLSFSGSVLKR